MVQALMLAASLGAITLAVLNLSQSSNKAQKGYDLTEEINQHSFRIKNYLNSRAGCFNTLNQLPTPFLAGTANKTSIAHIADNLNNPHFAVSVGDSDELRDLFVSDIEVIRGGDGFPNNFVRVIVHFEKKDRAKNLTSGTQSINKTFYVNAVFDGANTFQNCYTETDAISDTVKEITCTKMRGGVYNTANDPPTCDITSDLYSYYLSNTAGHAPADVIRIIYPPPPFPPGNKSHVKLGRYPTNDPETGAPREFDYCALAISKGSDGWKWSSEQICAVEQDSVNPRLWMLTNERNEAYNNFCKMNCFNVVGTSESLEVDPPDPPSGDPPSNNFVTNLITKLCEVITSCPTAPPIDPQDCENEVTASDGYEEHLGSFAPADYSSLGQMEQDEEDEIITPDEAKATSCLNIIDSTYMGACADPVLNPVMIDVQGGDYSTVYTLVSPMPVCDTVFP